ncbi:hypothetical protein P691DRAFT_811321 [Macrolepiota fuliginosa MF-IS2]|uniref:Xylanolytic transcriptional activator regulatory domain-containing protein n=1 Tax=Macrolepiota fuliginosa MF-IS2 TaxID=1400762 RepID=A0A9P5XEM6_9AGAR|nr:hypothetical protein P691DRAFT_811321 [Macrolepiota fuliginosa MF-IS2]
MILANTAELHDRIDHLTSRIRELEGALQSLQAQVSDQPHPLLQKDSFQAVPPLPSPSRPSSSSTDPPLTTPQASTTLSPVTPTFHSMDPDPSAVKDYCGTLSVSENGQSCFFGSTARLEFLAHRTAKSGIKPARLPRELIEFACQEPKTIEDNLGKEILRLRPQASEAFRLCELYLRNGKVMYSPIPRSELIDDILMAVYRAESFSDLRQPETLALLFMVFAMSCHFDPQKPVNDSNEHYYLARACLRLASHRENTLIYVQTLIHMAQYLHLCGTELTPPEALSEYLSSAIRIGYKMGLHLHGIRWNLSDDLAQRRSRIFCEIFLLDTWTSFYSGRPPMVSLAFMDQTTPTDLDEGIGTDGNRKPGFHTWTYKYAILLHSVMAIAFGPKSPPYSSVLDLDLKVRNFPVPAQWRPICEQETPAPPPEIHMARFMVLFAKESTLLHLHRAYFMSALEECPGDLSKHSFIPSVMAIYRSAWRLMRGLRLIWGFVPELISKMNVAWSQALSAAVVMCLFITRTPGSHLTEPALNELSLLVELFDEAVSMCQAANDLIGDLRSLRRYARASAGRSYDNEGDPISPSDLDRLSGKTYLLMLSGAGSAISTPLSPASATPRQLLSHHTGSSSHIGLTIKRDPSRATSATLSDLPATSPFILTTPLPMSSIHIPIPPHAPSSPPSHPHPRSPYLYTHQPSRSTHPHLPTSRTTGGGPSHPYTSSSSSYSIQSSTPSAPTPTPMLHTPQLTPSTISASTTHALHPTLIQDIRDFAMRGTPAGSSAVHYFDFPPDDIGTALSSTPGLDTPASSGRSHTNQTRTFSGGPASASTSTSRSPSGSRSRGHSIPGYLSQYQTQESDYGLYQSFESSFHLEYAPQPRSPFSAANFGIGMSGSTGIPTINSSYQDLVEHLGFH